MKACNSCGKCCIKYGNGRLSASEDDLEIWESLRPDIFRYVQKGKIWFDPETNRQIELCPWLYREPNQLTFSCKIYLDRPEDCRIYPATVNDMISDECEMLEKHDLTDLTRAKRVLKTNFTDR